jgi:hypothetical protein
VKGQGIGFWDYAQNDGQGQGIGFWDYAQNDGQGQGLDSGTAPRMTGKDKGLDSGTTPGMTGKDWIACQACNDAGLINDWYFGTPPVILNLIQYL